MVLFVFNFLKDYFDSSIIVFFNLLYTRTLFLKIKVVYFHMIFIICTMLHNIFLFNQFNMYIYF